MSEKIVCVRTWALRLLLILFVGCLHLLAGHILTVTVTLLIHIWIASLSSSQLAKLFWASFYYFNSLSIGCNCNTLRTHFINFYVELHFSGDQLDGSQHHLQVSAGELNNSQSDADITQDEVIDHGHQDDLQLSALQEYLSMIDNDSSEGET